MLFSTHSISLVISFFNMFLLYFGQVVEEIGIFARELRPRGFFGSKFSQVVYADKRGQSLLVEVVAESVGTETLAVNLFTHEVVLFCLTLAALSAVLHRNVQLHVPKAVIYAAAVLVEQCRYPVTQVHRQRIVAPVVPVVVVKFPKQSNKLGYQPVAQPEQRHSNTHVRALVNMDYLAQIPRVGAPALLKNGWGIPP